VTRFQLAANAWLRSIARAHVGEHHRRRPARQHTLNVSMSVSVVVDVVVDGDGDGQSPTIGSSGDGASLFGELS
jgi:hypothetical protein